jgi:hypothetical protein
MIGEANNCIRLTACPFAKTSFGACLCSERVVIQCERDRTWSGLAKALWALSPKLDSRDFFYRQFLWLIVIIFRANLPVADKAGLAAYNLTPSKGGGGYPIAGLNLACESAIDPAIGNLLVTPNLLSNLPDAAKYEA